MTRDSPTGVVTILLTCAGTAVPISSANAKGDMRMVISRRR